MIAESFTQLILSRDGERNKPQEPHKPHGPDNDRHGWWIVFVLSKDGTGKEPISLPPCYWENPQPGDFYVRFVSGWIVNFHGEQVQAELFARKYTHRGEPVVEMDA